MSSPEASHPPKPQDSPLAQNSEILVTNRSPDLVEPEQSKPKYAERANTTDEDEDLLIGGRMTQIKYNDQEIEGFEYPNVRKTSN